MPGLRHAIGFDIDLTLVDTRARILASAVAAFGDVGAQVDAEQIVPHLGIPLGHKAAALAPQVDAEEFAGAYRRHYASPAAPPALAYPAAATALQAVREAGYRVVVVSAKYPDVARQAVEESGLGPLVDVVHGGLFALEKAEALQAEHAVAYVGDHPGDMAAAHHAGAHAVAVTTGAHDRDSLVAAGAQTVLADLGEFPGWLSGFAADQAGAAS